MELLKLPEYSMPANFNLAHIYGEANIMADATSRGELEALRDGAAYSYIRYIEIFENCSTAVTRLYCNMPGNCNPLGRSDRILVR